MKITVRVVPRAKFNKVEIVNDIFRIHTTAVPTDGDANIAVIKLLSEHLKIPKSSIKLIRGTTSRDKVLEINSVQNAVLCG